MLKSGWNLSKYYLLLDETWTDPCLVITSTLSSKFEKVFFQVHILIAIPASIAEILIEIQSI